MNQLIDGALIMGLGAAGLFFFRFWRETRDRLFLFFGLAFFVLAANRLGLALTENPDGRDVLYWVRFVAHSLILLAIVDKNRSRKARDTAGTPPAR
jgi:hypothetical protein